MAPSAGALLQGERSRHPSAIRGKRHIILDTRPCFYPKRAGFAHSAVPAPDNFAYHTARLPARGTGASSNGRTSDFGSDYQGSNPCAPARLFDALTTGQRTANGHESPTVGVGGESSAGPAEGLGGAAARAD